MAVTSFVADYCRDQLQQADSKTDWEEKTWRSLHDWIWPKIPKPKLQPGQSEPDYSAWKALNSETEAMSEWLERIPIELINSAITVGYIYALHHGPNSFWFRLCERATTENCLNNITIIPATYLQSIILIKIGQIYAALAFTEIGYALAEQINDFDGAAAFSSLKADIYESRGELDKAIYSRQNYELPVYEKLGNVRSKAITIGKIADIYQTRGELDKALDIRQNYQLPVLKSSEIYTLKLPQWSDRKHLSGKGRAG